MPARVVRCRSCGALLNQDLEPAVIEAPESCELPEVKVMIELTPAGYFVGCPNCEEELRIAAKYLGNKVQCNFCESPFQFALDNPAMRQVAVYGECPHCHEELRIAVKYAGKRVGCKFCDGAIKIAGNDRTE